LIPVSCEKLRNEFMEKRKLHGKIDYIFSKTCAAVVPLPIGLNKDILMSKKVMLNQGAHYYSQVMPFAYAINMSLDMLKDEILELKALLP